MKINYDEKYDAQLKLAFQEFLEGKPVDTSIVRPEVYESWKRSRDHGLKHDGPLVITRLSEKETNEMRKENARFIQSARKHLNKIYDIIKPTGYYIFLSDWRGYLLDILSDYDLMQRFEEDPSLVVGASRAEKYAGTNAIGTCLVEGKALLLWGEEHYLNMHKQYTCAAAPVRGADGKIIGAISITGLKESYQNHTLAIVATVAEAVESDLKEINVTAAKNNTDYTFDNFIGESEGIHRLKTIAKRVAQLDSPILLWGESGTGKEVLAQSIHNESSRSDGPFIPINCGAIPKELIESELFGYEGGSFTGASQKGQTGKLEAASGGTIFLDEVESMPLVVQIKLLRALSSFKIYKVGSNTEIPIDVRIISATKSNLDLDSEEGRFREDLYYRINTVTLKIPPLRDRGDDIRLLADYYIDFFKDKMHFGNLIVPESFYEMLENYSWKGNVRELKNVVESAVAMSTEGGVIDTTMLPEKIKNAKANKSSAGKTQQGAGADLPQDIEVSKSNLKKFEVEMIKKALQENNGNISAAAKAIGIARSTLYQKLNSNDELLRYTKRR